MINLNKIYNFFFHPFAQEHSLPKKIASLTTVVALSLLSGGVFLLTFGVMNWKDRKIKKQKVGDNENSLLKKISHLFSFAFTKNSIQVQQMTPASLDKIKLIKEKHSEEIADFKYLATIHDWSAIHSHHYDWWMFPVNRPSSGYGDKFAVGKEEIECLKKDKIFMHDYRLGVILVVRAWGWDLKQDKAIKPPDEGQKWTNYAVRLGKMSDSLRLFGEKKLHQKLQLFFNTVCHPQLKAASNVDPEDIKWLEKTLSNDPTYDPFKT